MMATKAVPSAVVAVACLMAASVIASPLPNSPTDKWAHRDCTGQQVYTVTARWQWTAANFPVAYPSNAHFSPLVGATHSSAYTVFATGSKASPGVEAVAESGNTMTVMQEMRAQAAEGNVNDVAVYPGPVNGDGTQTIQLIATNDNSYVSILSMIAPSPDWFSGINSLDLCDRTTGTWRDNIANYPLRAYDAGTEEGTAFNTENAATDPADYITPIVCDGVAFCDAEGMDGAGNGNGNGNDDEDSCSSTGSGSSESSSTGSRSSWKADDNKGRSRSSSHSTRSSSASSSSASSSHSSSSSSSASNSNSESSTSAEEDAAPATIVIGYASIQKSPYVQCSGRVTYNVTSNWMWNGRRHPLDYPSDGRFGPLAVVSHNREYFVWQVGMMATAGVEIVAEEGNPMTLLTVEANAAQAAGSVLDYGTNGAPTATGSDSQMVQIEVSAEHPYVSTMSMLVPSPDWFSGVNAFDLCDHKTGAWRDAMGYSNVYDAGTEEGNAHVMDNAATDPQQPIFRIGCGDVFCSGDGYPLPVGMWTMVRA